MGGLVSDTDEEGEALSSQAKTKSKRGPPKVQHVGLCIGENF